MMTAAAVIILVKGLLQLQDNQPSFPAISVSPFVLIDLFYAIIFFFACRGSLKSLISISFWAEIIELLDSPQPQQAGGRRREQTELIGGGGGHSRERVPAAPGRPAQLPHNLGESIHFQLLIDIPFM
jgi:hypothetical protein